MSEELTAPAGVPVLTVDGGHVWLHDGIIYQIITVERIEVQHVVAVESAAAQVQGPLLPLPVLIDIRRVRWVSTEARERGAAQRVSQVNKAVALVVGSPVSRIVGSLFVRMSNPPYPLRLFDKVMLAIAWLESFRVEVGLGYD